MPSQDELNLRSEDVQDILTRMPHWMIRWGSTVICIIFGLLLIISWLIKYPDIISAPITITTNIPPERLVAHSSGKIEAILVQDRSIVNRGMPLAIIENAADYRDVFALKSILDTLDIQKQAFPFERFKDNYQLGDIELFYATFYKEAIANDLYSDYRPHSIENRAQNMEGIELRQRLNFLESQKDITEQELALQKMDLQRYEKLYDKGVIADQEFSKQKISFLQNQKSYKSLLSSISQVKSSINQLDKDKKITTVNESTDNITLQRNVLQAFYSLKKSIRDWELNYVLRASIKGTVNYLQIWKENQVVQVGENVFTIIPTDTGTYIGKIKASSINSGKIQVGQKVNIRLASYPDREYGVVKGKVTAISLTPDKDGNLLIDVGLPHGTTTSYNKKISFLQEMPGQADIITQNTRLLERFLYQLRGIFQNVE